NPQAQIFELTQDENRIEALSVHKPAVSSWPPIAIPFMTAPKDQLPRVQRAGIDGVGNDIKAIAHMRRRQLTFQPPSVARNGGGFEETAVEQLVEGSAIALCGGRLSAGVQQAALDILN